jgi:perosamine synthetase
LIKASTEREISSKSIYTQQLELNFRMAFEVPTAKVCNSGYSALLIALKLLRFQKGDEVIIPTFTMVAVANAVIDAGG